MRWGQLSSTTAHRPSSAFHATMDRPRSFIGLGTSGSRKSTGDMGYHALCQSKDPPGAFSAAEAFSAAGGSETLCARTTARARDRRERRERRRTSHRRDETRERGDERAGATFARRATAAIVDGRETNKKRARVRRTTPHRSAREGVLVRT